MSDKPNEPMGTQPAQNTDREIWRERADDYYTDSIHVTQGGGIGLDCGGLVIVKPIREWHALAKVDLPKPLPTSVDAPPQDVSEGELRSLFQDVIDEGCHCDMQVGFSCGIHSKVERLLFALNRAAERPAPAQAERQVAGANEIESLRTCLRQAAMHIHTSEMHDGQFDSCHRLICEGRIAVLKSTAVALPAERVSAEELEKLKMKWRELSEQPGLQRCSGRAGKVANIAFEVGKEVYAKCADELEAILRPTHTPEGGEDASGQGK